MGWSNLASGRLMPRDAFRRKRSKRDIDRQPGSIWTAAGRARDKVCSGDTILPMNAFWNSFETLLGLGVEPKDLTFTQISLRGIIVFLVALATVRLGHKRSLSRKTPFDAVLLVILASVLSRAINGSAAFFATLGGGVVLVLLHRLFAYLAFYSHGLGILVKGKPDVIMRDGQCDFRTMRRNHVSTHDLEEDMRLSAHTDDVSAIRLARIERSGDISFIKK
jgi:YetF C-terminal domain